MKQQLHLEPKPEPEPEPAAIPVAIPSDASRTERLLVLVLHHLGVAQELVDAAWHGGGEP